MQVAGLVALIVGVVVLVCVVWRYAALPCPSWLVPLLENPYFEAVASASELLRRAGVRPGMRVLDAGCGPGRMSIPLARAVGPSGSVTALDIQPRMLEKLRQRAASLDVGTIETIQAGLGEAGLPSDRFDVAFLVTVLGEVPDKLAALREIHRALRHDGVLSVTEVLPDPHYQSVSRVRQLAEASGFREKELFRGRLSFTVNLVKPVAPTSPAGQPTPARPDSADS